LINDALLISVESGIGPLGISAQAKVSFRVNTVTDTLFPIGMLNGDRFDIGTLVSSVYAVNGDVKISIHIVVH